MPVGVRQDDDGRLQALGAVHGHETDPAAGLLQIALDLHLAAAEPTEKALQRRGMQAFVGKGQREQLVQRVVALLPQPGAEAPAAVARAQKLRQQLEGRQEVELAAQLL